MLQDMEATQIRTNNIDGISTLSTPEIQSKLQALGITIWPKSQIHYHTPTLLDLEPFFGSEAQEIYNQCVKRLEHYLVFCHPMTDQYGSDDQARTQMIQQMKDNGYEKGAEYYEQFNSFRSNYMGEACYLQLIGKALFKEYPVLGEELCQFAKDIYAAHRNINILFGLPEYTEATLAKPPTSYNDLTSIEEKLKMVHFVEKRIAQAFSRLSPSRLID